MNTVLYYLSDRRAVNVFYNEKDISKIELLERTKSDFAEPILFAEELNKYEIKELIIILAKYRQGGKI